VALPRRRCHALQLASTAATDVLSSLAAAVLSSLAAAVLSSMAAALEVVVRSLWRDHDTDAVHGTAGSTSVAAPAYAECAVGDCRDDPQCAAHDGEHMAGLRLPHRVGILSALSLYISLFEVEEASLFMGEERAHITFIYTERRGGLLPVLYHLKSACAQGRSIDFMGPRATQH
jgi:hypothetical protein